MTHAQPMVEIHRGPFAESLHCGHAVICGPDGEIIESWGDPAAVVLPRSSSKMVQALPLVTSGAADAQGLSPAHLALACASHQGAPLHVKAVDSWLSAIDLSDKDLICGPQASRDKALRLEMLRADTAPRRVHNNCSGKHTGFLTLARHLKAGPDYVDPAHPVQTACQTAFEDMSGEDIAGFGIDGCSAPNYAISMTGMARAMARFASAGAGSDVTSRAATRLVEAMIAHPMLVAGEGRACTLLMQAAQEPVALKTGAEGYFVAILPKRGMGISLKIADGATRAADCAIAALLVNLGVLDPAHPNVQPFLRPKIRNWDGLETGYITPASGFVSAL